MSFTPIRGYDNYIFANMQLGMLQEQGINCHLKDEMTVTIDPLLSPALGGMKLMVNNSQLERAEQILEDAENEWVKTVPCPECGQTQLQKIVETTEFPGFWGKVKSLLINGQENRVNKYYSCLNCKKTFNEIM
ncbi:MAG: DUF2007 domain-containing protein [Gemmatimonadaceae bacterium]|nr:DUF2007 domain-containing protein [Chitinophagaceae bacterium]